MYVCMFVTLAIRKDVGWARAEGPGLGPFLWGSLLVIILIYRETQIHRTRGTDKDAHTVSSFIIIS